MIIFGSRIGQNPTGTAFSAVSQTSTDLWPTNKKMDLSRKSAQNEGFFTWTWVRLADVANRITSQDNSTAQPMSKMPAPLRRWPLPLPQQRAVPARRPAKFHPFRLDWLEQQKFLDSLQPYVADSQESFRKALRLTCLTLERVVIDSDEKNAGARILKKLLEETQVHLGSHNSQKQPMEKKNAKESEVRTTFFALNKLNKKTDRFIAWCFFCWDPIRFPPSLRTSEGQEVVLRMRLGPVHHMFRTC